MMLVCGAEPSDLQPQPVILWEQQQPGLGPRGPARLPPSRALALLGQPPAGRWPVARAGPWAGPIQAVTCPHLSS